MKKNKILIIGAGAAGVSCAVYLKRYNLELDIVSENIGGQISYATNIENYLGFTNISGQELSKNFESWLISGIFNKLQSFSNNLSFPAAINM